MKLTYSLCGCLLGGTSGFQVPSSFRTYSRCQTASLSTPLCAALVDIDENASRDIGAMDEWATNCGVQRTDDFQLTSEDGVDWSVMTTQPLAEGSPVLSVPGNMILSATGARQELGQVQAAEDLLGRLGDGDHFPQFYLFLKILTEYERGDESPWFPWLNSLPRLFNSGAAMTPFCYDCLPPLVASLAMEERVRFINFYQALKQADFLSEETKQNRDLAKWAYNVVYTRSFEMYGETRIVPMADMFNHGTETEIDFSYDEEGNCIVYATRDVPAGSPLRMSYGDPTNPSRLFATYGFLDETAPATFCKIMNIKPSSELRDIGLDFSRMLFYKDTGGVSQEVWDVLLYQVLASDKDTQKAFYEAHMTGDMETKTAIHQHYFLETSSALKKHVDTFLKQLDELSRKTLTRDLNEHPRIPLILRHNEFVKTTFLRVKDQIDPMVAQAAGESFV